MGSYGIKIMTKNNCSFAGTEANRPVLPKQPATMDDPLFASGRGVVREVGGSDYIHPDQTSLFDDWGSAPTIDGRGR